MFKCESLIDFLPFISHHRKYKFLFCAWKKRCKNLVPLFQAHDLQVSWPTTQTIEQHGFGYSFIVTTQHRIYVYGNLQVTCRTISLYIIQMGLEVAGGLGLCSSSDATRTIVFWSVDCFPGWALGTSHSLLLPLNWGAVCYQRTFKQPLNANSKLFYFPAYDVYKPINSMFLHFLWLLKE